MNRLALRILPALALLAGAACGPTEEERVMDELAARCAAQLGMAYEAAQEALEGGYPLGPVCVASLEPLAEGDSCGAASAEAEVCQVFYRWFSADPGECAGGACTCELRLRGADLEAEGGMAVVCAARFLRRGEVP